MNKQEFLALLDNKTPEAAMEFSDIMNTFLETSTLQNVKDGALTLDVLRAVSGFLEDYSKTEDGKTLTKPFTIEQAITVIETSLVRTYIETLEDS